jgi:hypothetical protein
MLDKARRRYGTHLLPDEEILDTVVGYAAGTGTGIIVGLLAGVFLGWLYALYLEAATLPATVLGGCAGVIAGSYLATRAARRPDGAGATNLLVAVTNTRLLTLNRHATGRPRILRAYPLSDIREVATHRLPVAHYHRQRITFAGGGSVELVVSRKLPIEPVNPEPTSG